MENAAEGKNKIEYNTPVTLNFSTHSSYAELENDFTDSVFEVDEPSGEITFLNNFDSEFKNFEVLEPFKTEKLLQESNLSQENPKPLESCQKWTGSSWQLINPPKLKKQPIVIIEGSSKLKVVLEKITTKNFFEKKNFHILLKENKSLTKIFSYKIYFPLKIFLKENTRVEMKLARSASLPFENLSTFLGGLEQLIESEIPIPSQLVQETLSTLTKVLNQKYKKFKFEKSAVLQAAEELLNENKDKEDFIDTLKRLKPNKNKISIEKKENQATKPYLITTSLSPDGAECKLTFGEFASSLCLSGESKKQIEASASNESQKSRRGSDSGQEKPRYGWNGPSELMIASLDEIPDCGPRHPIFSKKSIQRGIVSQIIEENKIEEEKFSRYDSSGSVTIYDHHKTPDHILKSQSSSKLEGSNKKIKENFTKENQNSYKKPIAYPQIKTFNDPFSEDLSDNIGTSVDFIKDSITNTYKFKNKTKSEKGKMSLAEVNNQNSLSKNQKCGPCPHSLSNIPSKNTNLFSKEKKTFKAKMFNFSSVEEQHKAKLEHREKAERQAALQKLKNLSEGKNGTQSSAGSILSIKKIDSYDLIESENAQEQNSTSSNYFKSPPKPPSCEGVINLNLDHIPPSDPAPNQKRISVEPISIQFLSCKSRMASWTENESNHRFHTQGSISSVFRREQELGLLSPELPQSIFSTPKRTINSNKSLMEQRIDGLFLEVLLRIEGLPDPLVNLVAEAQASIISKKVFFF